MGSFSIWHWLIVLVVVLLVFGAGKLPKVATDLAAGIKNFKKGMSDPKPEEEPAPATPAPPPGQIHTASTSGTEQKPVVDKVSG